MSAKYSLFGRHFLIYKYISPFRLLCHTFHINKLYNKISWKGYRPNGHTHLHGKTLIHHNKHRIMISCNSFSVNLPVLDLYKPFLYDKNELLTLFI